MTASDPEEVFCPHCHECGIFTIVNIGIGSYARCGECGGLLEIEIIGRYASPG